MFNKLSAAVSKYNKTGVIIQKKGCQQEDTSDGYREYRIDSEQNSIYMYGVKIANNYMDKERKSLESKYQDRLKRVAGYEEEKRKEYAVGTWEYAQLFKQVTGVEYEKNDETDPWGIKHKVFSYKTAQEPKSKTLKTCWQVDYKGAGREAREYSEDYNLPADWYYYTYTDADGNLQYSVEVPTLLYMQYKGVQAEQGDYENYTVSDTIEDKLLKDVTFYYEPLTIPQEQWDKISSTIEAKAKAYAIEKEGEDAYAPKPTNQLLMYYNLGDLSLSSKFYHYLGGILPSYTVYIKYDRKTTKSPGGGLTGLKAMWNKSKADYNSDKGGGWFGVCEDFTHIHETLCDLIGITTYHRWKCVKCNHAQSWIKITNTRGETGWVCLDNEHLRGSIRVDSNILRCKHTAGGEGSHIVKWTSDEFFTTNEGLW